MSVLQRRFQRRQRVRLKTLTFTEFIIRGNQYNEMKRNEGVSTDHGYILQRCLKEPIMLTLWNAASTSTAKANADVISSLSASGSAH